MKNSQVGLMCGEFAEENKRHGTDVKAEMQLIFFLLGFQQATTEWDVKTTC